MPKRELTILCPLGDGLICHGATDAYNGYERKAKQACAWWITGAECCAIALIARRLSEMAAVQYLSKRLEDVR